MSARTFKAMASPAFFVLVFSALVFLAVACQKRDLAVGEVLPAACAECHGSQAKYPLASARAGYDESIHKLGGNAFYSNGGGCQRCHTNEGFVKFVKTATVDAEGFEAKPSQPACFSCHDPHGTGTFALRVTEPLKLANGETFDGGKGNLCATCHQSRADIGTVIVETEASKVSARFGPHHSPQGDLFMGTNAYQYPGKVYDAKSHGGKISDSCLACHKAQPEGRFALSAGVGGHSFNMAGDVHEVETLNVSACVSCHPGAKQTTGTDVFSVKALADYDKDGTAEPFQLEVDGLLERLVNAKGTGYLQAAVEPPFYGKDGAWAPAKTGTRSVTQMAALFNYIFFIEDRSRGIHNPPYTIQILYDTIASLDPSFDVTDRP